MKFIARAQAGDVGELPDLLDAAHFFALPDMQREVEARSARPST